MEILTKQLPLFCRHVEFVVDALIEVVDSVERLEFGAATKVLKSLALKIASPLNLAVLTQPLHDNTIVMNSR